MQLTTYLHTALRVSDLARAEHFYGAVLGLMKVDRPLKYPGAWYQIGAVQLHLIVDEQMEPIAPPEKWGRDRHFALGVVDLEVAKAHLQAQGCELQMSASGRSALFTQDPDGNVIELTQVAEVAEVEA
ncbi:VOC family protein [Microcoleus sp. FACHB-1515]|uniref:VOC family protein n=1 Tax=Cyanophyceae TaxID=3028117 RepID=UPI001688631B|nr:VOC family protein [Microcoleus sp. FACHB-1515]MBD2090146.1 VOC family protein [Microcoleus sp. FACHB-1515]